MVIKMPGHGFLRGWGWFQSVDRIANERGTGRRHERPRAATRASPLTRVRPATHDELNPMGRLGRLLVRTHHELDPQRFIAAAPGTEHGYAAFLGEQLENPNAVVLVVERNGEVIGYSYSGIEPADYMALRGPAGVLHDLVVDPEYRGGGVGRILLDATLSALRGRGVPRVVLSTAEKNDVAKRLFRVVGFRPTMLEMTRELNDEGET